MNLLSQLYKAMWMIKEGWYLYYGNLGFEWLPSDSLFDEWVKNGEIG